MIRNVAMIHSGMVTEERKEIIRMVNRDMERNYHNNHNLVLMVSTGWEIRQKLS